jgi:magnesium chelatase subunit D
VNSAEASAHGLDDAVLALELFFRDPLSFGGIALRGGGPVREAMLEQASERLPIFRRIPAIVDAERLHGGLDLSATLASGERVEQPGLLKLAGGGVLAVTMADRLSPEIATPIAQALDTRSLAVILLDDGCGVEEAPPAVLMERLAFSCDLGALRSYETGHWPKARTLEQTAMLADDQLRTIAAMAAALGVHSARALVFAGTAARAHAALRGRRNAEDDDIAAAIRFVLAPRATQVPQAAPPAETPEQPQSEQDDSAEGRNERQIEDAELDDILLEAAAAAIPPHILDQIDQRKRGRALSAGRAGATRQSAQRGRPLGARAGVPGHGRRLALLASLRAAAPWQTIRRAAALRGDDRAVHIRKSDLRIRAFEQRSESLTIFAVDGSGSSALSRLAEAKGAVELMLAEAYVKRAQVALIAFRQAGAELLLPPTRSLTRARRALSALPGGGGTPLAAGLMAAQSLAEAATKRGQTPTIAVLTDGKANVRLDGTAGREEAMAEATAAAQVVARAAIYSIIIDIAPRPRPEAAALAAAMGGRYLPLPQANSAAMVSAIESVGAGGG